mmetsp:Transcript_95019/g.251074  ORF Transcript_95019/g.251074 Transcript_95019/m.251074 type:complete len:171 (+) Transcript_95019:2-514(+)
MDLEIVLCDLEGAETQAYGALLLDFAGHTGGTSVQPDDVRMRDFILTNSALSVEDLDTELLKVASASETFTIDLEGFLSLLRNHAINENDALQQFISLSTDGVEITSEDCRSGLLNLLQHRLHTKWPEQTNERVFDVVMRDAHLTIGMEQWITFSKQMGRIARLARHLQL